MKKVIYFLTAIAMMVGVSSCKCTSEPTEVEEVTEVAVDSLETVETPADTFVAAIFTIPFLNSALSLEDTVIPTNGRKIL